ncbi:nitronate monooxygenase [Chryseotalea sanaruensis]|uniref:Nitronate monooxygenase n=1 Tax=Chryseotalea sanaruensis TaxID=2482724 RepID=A0A401U5U9_9BACT|nr:nitronate monooxygenase [Chryseotalea sanaruensis]GCC50242.1 nitronate monooxygenase [Chryseotalea sanaruensis]
MTIDKMLGIDYPIIVAPMFLISNTAMIKAALDNGITAAFPALNYRTDDELRKAIDEIKAYTNKPFGVNLIVNKSNPKYKGQLDILVEKKVAFIITSLGNPKEVIARCKPIGIKVFCDVVDLAYAKKVEELGADAVIAVNSEAGGHAGNIKPQELISLLKANLTIPIISAGGIANASHLNEVMRWGAAGVSVGTIFIASEEAPVTPDYKQAMIDYGAKDIVRTTKLSGSALTVINTPYVQELGTEANWLERLMNKNKRLKKYIKLFIALKGMKAIEKAAFGATYKTLWCAGPSIEYVKAIRPMKEIVADLTNGYKA